MIVEALASQDLGPEVERTARVRWRGGEFDLRIRVPADAAAAPDDASPYLAAALLPAMFRGEDLRVEGAVSPRLLAAAEDVQAVYRGWSHALGPCRVEAAEVRAPEPRGAAVAACFSRGVDSCHTATHPRGERPALTHLVFSDGLDLRHDEAVRAQEVRRAREAAEAIAVPLLTVATNLREMTEPLMDWMDMAGAGLAFIGLSLAGGLRRLVVPSSDTWRSLQPCGTSPMIDPLYSTEAVEIEHDSLDLGRAEKVAAVVATAPALLPHLKVCFAENQAGNCGRCGKCLITMACLQAAGALDAATGFPDALDLERVRRIGLNAMHWAPRHEWAETARALAPEGRPGETRRAILDLLADGGPAVDPHDPILALDMKTFRSEQARTVVSLLRDGRPYPPVESDPRGGPAEGSPAVTWSASIGLVRGVDALGGRHVYGLGGVPAGRVTGELGALRARPGADGIAVRVTDEGQLATDAHHPPRPRPSLGQVARWLGAPLRWPGFGPVSRRARNVAWRIRRLLIAPAGGAPARGEPVGYLHRGLDPKVPWPPRRPLYAAQHPVTGDQLLSVSPHEAPDLGYGEPVELGWIEALAPVTGSLELAAAPLPWASRLGLHARRDAPSR